MKVYSLTKEITQETMRKLQPYLWPHKFKLLNNSNKNTAILTPAKVTKIV